MASSKNSFKLLYLLNHRFPTEKAYGIQIAKMCEAFADLGHEVTLVAPSRISKVKENFFRYYNIEKNFWFKKIFSPDFYLPGKLDRLAFYAKNFLSAFVLGFYALTHGADIIYSRDELPLYFISFFKKNIFFEAHRFSKNKTIIAFYRRFKKLNFKIIVISKNLKNEFVKLGFKPNNILVAPDGVDLEEFDIGLFKEEARRRLNLPQNKILIGYVGMLKTMGMEKGVNLLIESLKYLPQNILLVLVGGRKEDIGFYKKLTEKEKLSERVLFVGQVKHEMIPMYLKAFDILVMPFPYNQHYAFYMSPLKLFEYMASKRPIVATDLPSVREVLNEKNSVLIEPDNPKNLTDGIKFILENQKSAESLASQAFEDVQNYTWQKRAEKILGFIK